MKNLIQYRYSCEEAMFEFLKDDDVTKLIEELKRIEQYHKGIIECTDDELGLWFKFGSDDTLATTIEDIEKDLNLPSNHGNHKLLIDKFLLAIDNNPETELMIYFS